MAERKRKGKGGEPAADTGYIPVVRDGKGGKDGVKAKAARTVDWHATMRKAAITAVIVIMCLLVGLGCVSQIRSKSDNYETLSEDELVRLLDETNTQVDRLEAQRTELQGQLDTITNSTDKQTELNEVAKRNATTSGILSGRLACTGQGVRIVVTQTDTHIEAARLFTLVEELRNAGAEAISIGKVRVVADTYIVDTDQGVESDGELLESPYVIKAIGDPAALSNAITISGGIGSQLRIRYNATVTVTTPDSVTISELAEPRTYQYATIVE